MSELRVHGGYYTEGREDRDLPWISQRSTEGRTSVKYVCPVGFLEVRVAVETIINTRDRGSPH